MCGRHGAGAEAGLEPAPEPEPALAAGRGAPEHCFRGGRSSGYWVPPITFQGFFYGRDFVSRLAAVKTSGLHKLFLLIVDVLSVRSLLGVFLRRVRGPNCLCVRSNYYYVYSKTPDPPHALVKIKVD
jgi:hypothetical protein